MLYHSREMIESKEQTVSDQHMEKNDADINAQTWYGGISRKPDR